LQIVSLLLGPCLASIGVGPREVVYQRRIMLPDPFENETKFLQALFYLEK